jgi:hypothetical protein
VREKLQIIHYAFASCGRNVDILKSIVIHRWAQRVAMLAMGCPSSPFGWLAAPGRPVLHTQDEFCGSYILATLIHVSHGSDRRQFQMFVDCLLSQTWPSYEMSVFHRLQKGIFCGAEHGFVQVVN